MSMIEVDIDKDGAGWFVSACGYGVKVKTEAEAKRLVVFIRSVYSTAQEDLRAEIRGLLGVEAAE